MPEKNSPQNRSRESHAERMDRERKERIEKARLASIAKAKAREEAEWQERWGWKEEGRKAYEALKKPFRGIVKYLGPHLGKKQVDAELLSHVEALRTLAARPTLIAKHTWNYDVRAISGWAKTELAFGPSMVPHSRNFGSRLNRVLNARSDARFHRSKSEIIRYYWRVLKQINPNVKIEARSHSFIEKYLVKRIRIPIKNLMHLKMTQLKLEQAYAKYDEICRTITRNEGVETCRSPQHKKASGCPICGANYTKNGVMVHAVDRKTGVATLVPLESELEILRAEEAEHADLIDSISKELHILITYLQDLLSGLLQNWWCRKLARRRSEKEASKLELSLWNFRNRRLVKMMKMFHTKRYTLTEIEAEFPDLHVEITEHGNAMMVKHTEMISRMSNEFLHKLRNAVILRRRKQFKHDEEVNRERRQREATKEESGKGRDIQKMRERVYMWENTRWHCSRPGCQGRVFLTIDRFDTHCKFHRMDDERQRKRRQELARIKEFRGQIEDVFIDRLRIARVLDPQGSALQLEEKGDPEYPLLLETTPAEDFESGDGERDVRDEAVVQGEEEQAQVKSRSKDDIDRMLAELDRLHAFKYSRRDTELKLARENWPQLLKDRKDDFNTLTHLNRNSGFHYTINGLPGDFVQTEKASNLKIGQETVPEGAEYDMDALKPVEWSATPHIWTVNSFLNHYVYHLELLSKHGDVVVPYRFPLDKPTIRIGSLPYCELRCKTKGLIRQEGMISKIHTVIKVPVSQADGFSIQVLDNCSLWGTYIVSKRGGRKVPSKITLAMKIEPGDLLCVGVVRDGPMELNVQDAGRAAVVYRVRCHEIETSSS